MLSQYANSPTIVKLVEGIKGELNNAQTIGDWFRLVFNLKTAYGAGLDIWGKILDQSRRFIYTDSENNKFDVYLQGEQTIDGVHYSAEEIEEKYRMILFFKSFSYITNSSIKSLNDLLQFYFEDKSVYVYEIDTMVIGVVFRFFVSKLEKAIFASDIFPKPTGVGLNFYYIENGQWFGFYDNGHSIIEQPFAPFDESPFYPYIVAT